MVRDRLLLQVIGEDRKHWRRLKEHADVQLAVLDPAENALAAALERTAVFGHEVRQAPQGKPAPPRVTCGVHRAEEKHERICRMLLAMIVLLATSLVGCAGRDFVRPSSDSLVLGKTTYGEIIARFGSPYREGTMLKNEQTFKTITYAYASKVSGPPLVSGVTPARATAFYFSDLVLVGHEFTSSFQEDHSDFDETKVTRIKKGETTKTQVIELMGAPTGMYVYPLIQQRNDNGLVYVYSQTRVIPIPFAPKILNYRKALIVSIDGNGVVSSVDFNASGEK